MDLKIFSVNASEFKNDANQLMEIAEIIKAAEPRDKPVYMITNVLLENKKLDCILLTEKGPILIDCKTYQGNISGLENGVWKVMMPSGQIVDMNNNPFEQSKDHRLTFLRKWQDIVKKHFTNQIPERQLMHFCCWVYFMPGSEFTDDRFYSYRGKWFKVVTKENLIKSIEELNNQYRISKDGYDKVIKEFGLDNPDPLKIAETSMNEDKIVLTSNEKISDRGDSAVIHEIQTPYGPVPIVIQESVVEINLPIRTQSRTSEFLNAFNEATNQFKLKDYGRALILIDFALRKDHYDKEAQDLKYDILCLLGKEKEAEEFLIKAIKK